LYVVVAGLIYFRPDDGGTFCVVESKTRVAYFLKRRGQLEHLYGVHHNFDATHVAHPVFHSQMAPMMEHHENIWKRHGTWWITSGMC